MVYMKCMWIAVVQEPKQVVSNTLGLFSESNVAKNEVDKFDVLVCGGTLGIFVATALSLKGLRVGVVEQNLLKGVCICSGVQFFLNGYKWSVAMWGDILIWIHLISEGTRMEYIKKRAHGTCWSWHLNGRWYRAGYYFSI